MENIVLDKKTHKAVKIVAVEVGIPIQELASNILLADKNVKKVYDRIE